MTAALVQLHAWQATEAAAEALAAETRRRELDAARLATHAAAREEYGRRIAGIETRRDGGDDLLFSVP